MEYIKAVDNRFFKNVSKLVENIDYECAINYIQAELEVNDILLYFVMI